MMCAVKINILPISEHLAITIPLLQELFIDIPFRNPTDSPSGIPYKLFTENCNAAIDTENIRSIFEEHHIIHNLGSWYCVNTEEGCGVYIQEEKKFQFSNTLVGSPSQARFKLKNISKVSALFFCLLNRIVEF